MLILEQNKFRINDFQWNRFLSKLGKRGNMWKIPLIIGIVALVAVLGVLLYVTEFTAYLGSDPAMCNTCHVMDYVYEGWYHAGHSQATTCSDCHTPHAFLPKYWVKAKSGFHDVVVFLFGEIPSAIRATEETRAMIQENCIRCHATTVADIGESTMDGGRYCFDCHRSAAHGDRGISIYPFRDLGESK
jgi:cytochrome c nitrite reductase small subunit